MSPRALAPPLLRSGNRRESCHVLVGHELLVPGGQSGLRPAGDLYTGSHAPRPGVRAVSPEAGSNAADRTLEIRGRNLDPTFRVFLGQRELPVEFVDPTLLRVLVPAGFEPGVHELSLADAAAIARSRPVAKYRYRVVGETSAPPEPSAYVALPARGRVRRLRFDAAASRLTGVSDIPIPGGPRRVCLTPDGDYLYALNTETTDVSCVSTARETEVARIELGPDLYGAVADRRHGRRYPARRRRRPVGRRLVPELAGGGRRPPAVPGVDAGARHRALGHVRQPGGDRAGPRRAPEPVRRHRHVARPRADRRPAAVHRRRRPDRLGAMDQRRYPGRDLPGR